MSNGPTKYTPPVPESGTRPASAPKAHPASGGKSAGQVWIAEAKIVPADE
jgi:hypothetical protein